MRFLLALCAMIGVSIWWALAPFPLLVKPEALSADARANHQGYID